MATPILLTVHNRDTLEVTIILLVAIGASKHGVNNAYDAAAIASHGPHRRRSAPAIQQRQKGRPRALHVHRRGDRRDGHVHCRPDSRALGRRSSDARVIHAERLRAALNHCGHPNTVGLPAAADGIHGAFHWDSLYGVQQGIAGRDAHAIASRRTRMSSMTAADQAEVAGKSTKSSSSPSFRSSHEWLGIVLTFKPGKFGARHRRDHRHLAFDRRCRSAHTGDRRKGRADGVRNCRGLLSIVIALILLHHTTTTVAVARVHRRHLLDDRLASPSCSTVSAPTKAQSAGQP